MVSPHTSVRRLRRRIALFVLCVFVFILSTSAVYANDISSVFAVTQTSITASVATDVKASFTVPADVTYSFGIDFPAYMSGDTVTLSDIDLSVNGTDIPLVQSMFGSGHSGSYGAFFYCSGSNQCHLSVFLDSDSSATIASGSTVVVQVGTNASGGTNQLVNHNTSPANTPSLGYHVYVNRTNGGTVDTGDTTAVVGDVGLGGGGGGASAPEFSTIGAILIAMGGFYMLTKKNPGTARR